MNNPTIEKSFQPIAGWFPLTLVILGFLGTITAFAATVSAVDERSEIMNILLFWESAELRP